MAYVKLKGITGIYCQDTMNKILSKLRLPAFCDDSISEDIVEFKVIEGNYDIDLKKLKSVYINRKILDTINDDMPDECVSSVKCRRSYRMYVQSFFPDPSPYENENIKGSIACADLEAFAQIAK